MPITTGIRSHRCYVIIDGTQYPIADGSVSQSATKKSATFTANLPMATSGLMDQVHKLGENTSSIVVVNGSTTNTLIEGEIDTVEFDYIGGTVSMNGRCKSAKLHEMKSHEKFANKKNSDVVKDLAGRVGLKTDVDDSPLQAGKYVQIDWSKITDGVTFSSIIHKAAEVDGAKWWVSNGTLHYKTSTDGAGSYTVNYEPSTPDSYKSSDATRIRITYNIPAAKTIKSTVKSWNKHKKQTFTGTTNITGVKGTTTLNLNAPDLEQSHVDKHSKSKARDAARHEFSVHVECVGDTSIDVSMKLVLSGTNYHDQAYEIETINHKVGMNGHGMSIEAKSSKKGRDGSAGGGQGASKVSPSKSGATTPTAIGPKAGD